MTADTQSMGTKFFVSAGATSRSRSSEGPLVEPIATRVSRVWPSRSPAKKPW
jgi:hypothetical protein